MKRTQSTSTATSQVEYSDPEIKSMERQIKQLELAQKTVSGDDHVVTAFPSHSPDGSVIITAVTANGHVWETVAPWSGTSSVQWGNSLPPVPNTPAALDYIDIADLKEKIAYRRRTRGGSKLDRDIEDLIDPEE